MQRKRSRLGLAAMDTSAVVSPRRSLSWAALACAGSVALASSAPRSSAPESYFDEAACFLGAPRRTASGPLTACGSPERDDDRASPSPAEGESPGSALDWEPDAAAAAADGERPRRNSGGDCWRSGEEDDNVSPLKRSTAWRRFAVALAAEGDADAGGSDGELERAGACGGGGWGSGGGGAAVAQARAPAPPYSSQPDGRAADSPVLLEPALRRCPFQAAPEAEAWILAAAASARVGADPTVAFAAPPPAAFGSQPHPGGEPHGSQPPTQLPFAGEAWHTSQPPPEFYSQREPAWPASQPAAPCCEARAPSPPPLQLDEDRVPALRAGHDASRTPPHYSMCGYGAEMSPGETGGSQYIASPLLHASCASLDLAPQHAAAASAAAAAAAAAEAARQPLFPIFLPRGQKTLHLVRHGESEYNAACGAPGSSWDEPLIWDAPLSALGVAQAAALGPTLAALVSPGVLWVASPLTRAVQTGILARAAMRAADAARWAPPPCPAAAPWLAVRAELAEHLVTSGDVGRPAAVLADAFAADVSRATFAHLPEPWWFCPAGRPNCALRGVLQAAEPKEALKKRIGAFRKWVISRPESEMVVFGHSTFFKYFTNSENRLKNCEVVTVRI